MLATFCLGLMVFAHADPSGFVDPAADEGADNDVRSIAQRIRRAHNSLLQVKGGISIRYRIDVRQSKENPVFVWADGLDGILSIKWPMLRSTIRGPMFVDPSTRAGSMTVREGNYNFETQAGVAREGDAIGQVVNYRHAFSAGTAFPLLFQYYAEMDQFYVPGKPLQTDTLLPNAIEQHPYVIAGKETVDGVPCIVLQRRQLDTLWIASSHGYLVYKRELRSPKGLIEQRLKISNLREVASNVWLPTVQVREDFDEKTPMEPILTLTSNLVELRVGDLRDEDTHISLTKDIRYIEDHISKKKYWPSAETKDFDRSVRWAVANKPQYARYSGQSDWVVIVLLAMAAICLGLWLLMFLHKRNKPKDI